MESRKSLFVNLEIDKIEMVLTKCQIERIAINQAINLLDKCIPIQDYKKCKSSLIRYIATLSNLFSSQGYDPYRNLFSPHSLEMRP